MQPFERAWYNREVLPPMAVARYVYEFAEEYADYLMVLPDVRCRVEEWKPKHHVNEVMKGLVHDGFCLIDEPFKLCPPVPVLIRLLYCPLIGIRVKTTRALVEDMLRVAVDEWSNRIAHLGDRLVVAP